MSSQGQPKVSLFPFMSVLACTIGALMLLLVAMSLSAVGSSRASVKAVAVAERASEVDQQIAQENEKLLTTAEALWREVDATLAERGLTPGLSLSSIEREISLIDERDSLMRSIRKNEDALRELDLDRESIETTISVLESRRETLPILIDTTGLSSHHKPFFVECDAEGVTAYRASDDFSYFVAKDDMSTSGNFGRYLNRIRVEPGALLVLLVRPDGIASMSLAARTADAKGILRVARLPLPGSGELDWSLLRRAEGGDGGEG